MSYCSEEMLQRTELKGGRLITEAEVDIRLVSGLGAITPSINLRKSLLTHLVR